MTDKSQTTNAAYWMGRVAFFSDQPRNNPHPEGSPLARAWDDGWLDAWDESHSNEMQECEEQG